MGENVGCGMQQLPLEIRILYLYIMYINCTIWPFQVWISAYVTASFYLLTAKCFLWLEQTGGYSMWTYQAKSMFSVCRSQCKVEILCLIVSKMVISRLLVSQFILFIVKDLEVMVGLFPLNRECDLLIWESVFCLLIGVYGSCMFAVRFSRTMVVVGKRSWIQILLASSYSLLSQRRRFHINKFNFNLVRFNSNLLRVAI